MQLPPELLDALEKIPSFDRASFKKEHDSAEQLTSIRINPGKNYKLQTINNKLETVPWSQYGSYLSERPSFTFDPLFHAGCYYVQEASSMFLEQAIKQTVDLSKPLTVLDLCAAPGGKSTHIQSLLSNDSMLVSNDVIRSRANILKQNIIKWGCQNVVVTNNDPRDFYRVESYFDLVVVDAPCSGSGLFRKDPAAIEEWSPNNVMLCSQRQQRILADVFPSLKENGILVYCTCSYSPEENERVSDWLLQSFPLEYRPLRIEDNWGLVDTGKGYRFWPDKLKGEGFYISCFQKKTAAPGNSKRRKLILDPTSSKEKQGLEKWINAPGTEWLKFENKVYIWPVSMVAEFNFLLDRLQVIYSGVLAGDLMRDKLVPAHSLAMSNYVAEQVVRFAVNEVDAIRYLQRKTWNPQIQEKGWQIVTYKEFNLGWINALGGRINNYYPKELRIIKDN